MNLYLLYGIVLLFASNKKHIKIIPMKKLLIFSAALFFVSTIFAGNEPVPVKSEIRDVTVFLSGAQVTRTGSANIEEGTSVLIFTGLPQSLNQESIQVKGGGNFTILSVTQQLNYLVPREKTNQIKFLEDSLESLKKQVNLEQAILKVYQEEENFLLANKQIGGQNTGVRVDELKAALELYRSRLTETAKLKLKSNLSITNLNDKINRISSQLSTLNGSNAPTSEVLVSITAHAAGTASVSLSYLVPDAGWIPEYDLRAIDVKNPVELTYKANVFQNSNENWKNVKLTLSTGNPAQGGSNPLLQPWYLVFQELVNIRYSTKTMAVASMAPMELDKEKKDAKSEDVLREEVVTNYVTTGQTTASFNITIPYTIPADGKKYLVEIQKNTLQAVYEYQCVPKLDPDAFLVARIAGWEGFNYLSGPMNLFFEGTFVGKSYLDMQNTHDTLELSLGRDKNIVVKRERRKDFVANQVFGSNRKESRAFDISVRNSKKQDIEMVIMDQVPISTNKDIVVDASEISAAVLEKETGKLSWKFQLKSSETRTLRLAYEVKYPKDKKVILE
jgi:uncharacterized protein (TIGR02231 family)